MSVIFYECYYLAYVLFLDCWDQAGFQWNMDTYGGISILYIVQLYIWILFSFIDSHDLWGQSRVSSKVKLVFLLFYLNPFISNMYIMDQNSSLPISHDLCYVLWLYFTSYHMCQFSTYFEYKKVLEYFLTFSSQDYLDWVDSQMNSNTIHYLEFQTWNMYLQPAYNRCKIIIQIILCSISRPYKTLSWTFSILKSRLSTS